MGTGISSCLMNHLACMQTSPGQHKLPSDIKQSKRSWRTWIIHIHGRGLEGGSKGLDYLIDWQIHLFVSICFDLHSLILFTEWLNDWQRKWTILRLTYWLSDRKTDRQTDWTVIRHNFFFATVKNECLITSWSAWVRPVFLWLTHLSGQLVLI